MEIRKIGSIAVPAAAFCTAALLVSSRLGFGLLLLQFRGCGFGRRRCRVDAHEEGDESNGVHVLVVWSPKSGRRGTMAAIPCAWYAPHDRFENEWWYMMKMVWRPNIVQGTFAATLPGYDAHDHHTLSHTREHLPYCARRGYQCEWCHARP